MNIKDTEEYKSSIKLLNKITMNKEFVPYEEALALKELGFDEPCFGIWIERGSKYDVMYVAKQEDAWMAEQNDGILAPLYQQAFRWLYQKLDIEKGVMPLDTESQQLLLEELIDKVSSKHLLV